LDEEWVPTTGDRVVLHGVIVDARPDFALVTVDGSSPPSTFISVDYNALQPESQPPVWPPPLTS